MKGTIRNYNNTHIVYKTNPISPDCKNGFIKMDISFDRVLYGGKRVSSCSAKTPWNNFGSNINFEYSRLYPGHDINDKIKLRTRTSRTGIVIGKINCPATCIECDKSKSTEIEGKYGCSACVGDNVLAHGKCIPNCPDKEYISV